ncbi:MAG: 30S ribosome-binding factor RbfA [Clostridia bacterium]|nr:30S ribosome-binding factor RbfA [Clostridia bacterium]
MGAYRQDRVNDAVAREMTELLRRAKDPRISGAFVSVSGARVSGDLSQAKIYYSVLGPDEGVEEGLKSASGYLRSELARTLNLRVTPKLIFVRDHGPERAMDIALLLKEEKEHASSANSDNQSGDDPDEDQ